MDKLKKSTNLSFTSIEVMHSLFTSFPGSGTFAKNGSTDPALIYRVVSRELKKYCWLQNLECKQFLSNFNFVCNKINRKKRNEKGIVFALCEFE